MLDGFKHHLNVVRSHATKHVVQKFADDMGLVYFGHVDQHIDEHELIRGVTVSTEHHDAHYCVGSIHEYDVTLVQRTDVLHFPGKTSQHHTWLILQFDLHTQNFSYPHMFLDGKHKGAAFYANLFVKFRHLQKVDHANFAGHEHNFVNQFTVYMPTEDTYMLAHILTPDFTAGIARHFSHFDFELFDDRLLVYANNTVASKKLLEDMTKSGLWLARHLDHVART